MKAVRVVALIALIGALALIRTLLGLFSYFSWSLADDFPVGAVVTRAGIVARGYRIGNTSQVDGRDSKILSVHTGVDYNYFFIGTATNGADVEVLPFGKDAYLIVSAKKRMWIDSL